MVAQMCACHLLPHHLYSNNPARGTHWVHQDAYSGCLPDLPQPSMMASLPPHTARECHHLLPIQNNNS